jgi:hypothetical protein
MCPELQPRHPVWLQGRDISFAWYFPVNANTRLRLQAGWWVVVSTA